MTTTTSSPRPVSGWMPGRSMKQFLAVSGVSFLGFISLLIFLMPLGYVFLTSLKTSPQIMDPHSQLLPSSPVTFKYESPFDCAA